MTIEQMHDWFDLVQDKYNSPNFIAVEKDQFINRAQEKFVNDIIFRDILGMATTPKGVQALYHIEDAILSNELLRTITYPDKAVDTDGTGTKVTYASISSSLMHILAIRASSSNSGNINNSKALRYIRHNDQGRFNDNTFKKGSTSKPYYKIGNDGVYLYPTTGAEENLLISYIDKPADVVYSSGTDCVLPSETHEKIVAMALELAGVATETEVLLDMHQR